MGFLSLILWNHKLSKSFQFTASSTTFYVYIHTDLNTLDWGRNNLVAIGLGPDVFLWNAGDGSVRKLLELNREGDYVCSVSWAGNGKYLAVGSNGAAIQLWDVEKEKRVRTMGGHTDRVGVLTWSKHTLTRYVCIHVLVASSPGPSHVFKCIF